MKKINSQLFQRSTKKQQPTILFLFHFADLFRPSTSSATITMAVPQDVVEKIEAGYKKLQVCTFIYHQKIPRYKNGFLFHHGNRNIQIRKLTSKQLEME